MSTTLSILRTFRVENEAGLTGTEAPEVEGCEVLDQTVSAGTEEQLAMGAFKDHQLQAMALLSDVVAEAQFLGMRYTLVSSTGAGAPGVLHANGDLTQEIFPGDLVRIEGTVGNDGIYLVFTVAFGADTTITFDNGQDCLSAEGAVGTVARVASAQRTGYAYPVLATVIATGAITYTGNVSDKFAAGEALVLAGTVGCDGYFRISSVAYLAGVTTIIVLTEAGVVGLPAAAGVGGYFQKMEPAFNLAAGVPFQWSIDSGLDNPFMSPDADSFSGPIFGATRGDVAYCMVNVAGIVNSLFKGRVAKNAIL